MAMRSISIPRYSLTRRHEALSSLMVKILRSSSSFTSMRWCLPLYRPFSSPAQTSSYPNDDRFLKRKSSRIASKKITSLVTTTNIGNDDRYRDGPGSNRFSHRHPTPYYSQTSSSLSSLSTSSNDISPDNTSCRPNRFRIFRNTAAVDAAFHYAKEVMDGHVYRLARKSSRPPSNPFRTESDKEKQAKKEEEESEESSSDDPNKKDPKKPSPQTWFFASIVAAALWHVLAMFNEDSDQAMMRYVSWNEFVSDMLSRGEVKELVVHPESETIVIHLHPDAVIKGAPVRDPYFRMKIQGVEQFEQKLRSTENELGIPENGKVPIVYRRSSNTFNILIPLIVFALILYGLSRAFNSVSGSIGSNFSSFSKAKFTIIDPSKPSTGKLTSFKDVAGMEEAKREVLEFVDYLKDPTRFKQLGAKAPRGALLLGPPGCGKTLLARAVAAEAHVPFLAMAGSEFVEMIGGLGAARVRDLFKEARKRNPCIVYVDEIDAVGRKRSDNSSAGGSGEEEQTLNQLLVEMDGMSTTEGVIMLASTNRADILDKALLRPGRFDRQIEIDAPTASERKDIFQVYLNKLTLAQIPEVYSQKLAARTPGMTGADIANVCNEAALHAAREGQKKVDTHNFDHAVERVVFGTEKKSKALQFEERRVVATHEAGHALCGWLLEHTEALMKVSIVPRTNHNLGYSQTVPSDLKLYNKEQLFDRMCMALGGRVAELLIFNKVTSGAEDDLKRVTKMAYRQIRLYGMNETIGNLSFDVDTQQSGNFSIKPYSKALGTLIDAEARKLVHQAFRATEDLLRSHLPALKTVSSELLEKEVLNYADVEKLIGPPPFATKQKVDPVEWERFTAHEGADENTANERARSPSPPRDDDGEKL